MPSNSNSTSTSNSNNTNTSGGNTDTTSSGLSTTSSSTTSCISCGDATPVCETCIENKANEEANAEEESDNSSDESSSEESTEEATSTDTSKSWKNHCPFCDKDETLTYEGGSSSSSDEESESEGEAIPIICDTEKEGCGATYCPTCGKMIEAGTNSSEDEESSDESSEDDTSSSKQLEPCDQGLQQVQGGSAQVKDKTFEACIRRICAATDSVFIVENNAAILFPYTDWMQLTLKQQLKKIESKSIDPNVFEFEYNTEGFYNKVTIGSYSVQYDALVKIYGELEKVVETEIEDPVTAEYVANALLIQYVREFNNSCKIRVLNNQKFLGGTFYVVEHPLTKVSELYYLQGYTIRTQKDEPLYIDMDFRYGPEGAEELGDYQAFSGASSGGQTASSTEDQIWADAAKCKWAQDQPDCSTNDPETAKKHYDEYTQKGEEVHFDCFGMSAYLYYRFNNEANIPCRVVGDSNHKVVMLYKNNDWQSTREQYQQLDYKFRWRTPQNTALLLDAPNSPSGSSSSSKSNVGSEDDE